MSVLYSCETAVTIIMSWCCHCFKSVYCWTQKLALVSPTGMTIHAYACWMLPQHRKLCRYRMRLRQLQSLMHSCRSAKIVCMLASPNLPLFLPASKQAQRCPRAAHWSPTCCQCGCLGVSEDSIAGTRCSGGIDLSIVTQSAKKTS